MTEWNVVKDDDFELHFGYPDEEVFAGVVETLVADKVASGIARRDATLWGTAAESEAGKRLSWVDLAEASRPLVADIATLRKEFLDKGLTRFVLCGMGGSSLAPEVICTSAGVDLEVLDSSNPDVVRAAVAERLSETVVIVSSKSGGTVETDSQKRAFEQAFRDAGIEPGERIVVVTDPGSPLDEEATAAGYTVFRADPDVGGRYSALTAFGLVPSGLAGADIAVLLDEAARIRPHVVEDSVDNPVLRLGGLLGWASTQGIDKVVLANAGASFSGFGDWAEQLLAESTGKDGKGILPVVVEGLDSPNFSPSTADSVLVSFGPDFPFDSVRPASSVGASVDAPLGAQMMLWEFATAVAGRVIGINPFDQPDVESAKAAAREMLDGAGESASPRFSDGAISVFADDWLDDATDSAADAVAALLGVLDGEHGYLAVQAYLDRHRDVDLERCRPALAERTGRPVTFGWGPRFLHSTGQYHKGGPSTGVYLQITGTPEEDLAVPGRDFSFGDFLIAQAVGDGQVLGDKGRPVLRLHLDDLRAGLNQLRGLLA
ncbi:glucose-6-phosphate isomerase [Nocardioides sp. JQ2195]|uniref:glucose-6-phosphate isomerase n=1 Tax=Nocardioides sp. JQ2195 TaxID=2592334 RepID=UPI00143ED15B|nr:glucose-6-phosphate isomerase [Nocardioides sp. JQ2195]QIX26795.1 glucose-6-phosphate isomerase [Nocardioides sp. JQ2195]